MVNAYFTLAGLVASAVLALVQGVSTPVPPPWAAMRAALAGIHSYREVQASTRVLRLSTGHRALQTTVSHRQQVTVVVRQGAQWQVETVITTSLAGGGQAVADLVRSGRKACVRQGGAGRWHCAVAATAAPPMLVELAGLRWVAVPARIVQGQRCRGYRTSWQPAADAARTRAVLWVSAVSGRPVELVSVATAVSAPAGTPSITATTSTTDTVVWEAWNDPSLAVPRV